MIIMVSKRKGWKMRKFFVLGLILTLVIGSSAFLFADESTGGDLVSYRLSVGNKFARGFKNVLLGWTELPNRFMEIAKETNDIPWAILAGTFQGTLKALARTASGVSDILTAPISPTSAPFIQPDINVE